jgi:hypothetical protein
VIKKTHEGAYSRHICRGLPILNNIVDLRVQALTAVSNDKSKKFSFLFPKRALVRLTKEAIFLETLED